MSDKDSNDIVETDASDDSASDVQLSWEQIGLTETSLAAVARMGYDTPTEVQQKAIGRVHAGGDLIVQAKTGSGKTLAFGLPILEKLDMDKKEVQALVLSPTRELAVQVGEEITRAGELGRKLVVPVFGGASMTRQIQMIRDGARVVVGTPGRILDHLRRGTLKLDKAWMVVLDEADEMLDRGFLPDVMKILDHTPSEKQTMLFSATIPAQIKSMAQHYLNDPETIMIGKAGLSINYDIHHSYYRVPTLHKFVALVNILYSLPLSKGLIFCNMKSDTESVAEYLHEEGFSVGFLSGDLSQAVRTKTLNMFKDGIIDLLVATDVAARGIDIYGISHVINYDVPENKELYVHRTGRTGRAGRRGEAVSLVAPGDILGIGTIQRNMGVTFDELPVPELAEVKKGYRKTFMAGLRNLEVDGYPDDLALYADELLEDLDPYTVVAGLLTKLRQRGWELSRGYDPDNPEVKERLFVRPALLGKRDLQQRNELRRGGAGRGGPRSRRDGRGGSEGGRRGTRDERPKKESKPHDRGWMVLELDGEASVKGPASLISLVSQTAGIKKQAFGKIEINDDSVRFEMDSDKIDQVIEGFERRKKDPMGKARRAD